MNTITKKIYIGAIIVFLFGSGYKLGQYSVVKSLSTPQNLRVTHLSETANAKNVDFSLFWEVWNKLNDKFVDRKKLDTQKLYLGAIKGMVDAAGDPYTFFLTPKENQLTKDDLGGKFEGIGAQLGLKDNAIVVIAPLKNSPAEKAGLRSGDAISKVDGTSTKNWTLFQAVSKIRGEKGSKVMLTLLRDTREVTVSIIRDEIDVKSVELSYEKNVAVVKLTRFGDDTNDEWNKAVSTIAQKWNAHEIKGMVLDLRDNPGGYLESSVYIASDFLADKSIVVRQQYIDDTGEDHHTSHPARLLNIPVVVLINKGSASASEIVAGALRDYKRATLVGEQSFGKGSIQEALEVGDGAGLHVTIAKWILPKGDWINEKGVKPDITVENKIDEKNTPTKDDDMQLKKALEVVVK